MSRSTPYILRLETSVPRTILLRTMLSIAQERQDLLHRRWELAEDAKTRADASLSDEGQSMRLDLVDGKYQSHSLAIETPLSAGSFFGVLNRAVAILTDQPIEHSVAQASMRELVEAWLLAAKYPRFSYVQAARPRFWVCIAADAAFAEHEAPSVDWLIALQSSHRGQYVPWHGEVPPTAAAIRVQAKPLLWKLAFMAGREGLLQELATARKLRLRSWPHYAVQFAYSAELFRMLRLGTVTAVETLRTLPIPAPELHGFLNAAYAAGYLTIESRSAAAASEPASSHAAPDSRALSKLSRMLGQIRKAIFAREPSV